MKKFTWIIACFVLLSCNNTQNERPTDAIETGRVFIRASLDGDFKTAEKLLYKDSLNVQFFDSYKTLFTRLSPDKKKRYKESNYNINKYEDINDSTTIINYSNSYMNRPMEIKVIKVHGDWWVDFKYVSSGNLPIN